MTTLEVDVIEDASRAQVLLDPTRLKLLEHLGEPSSATALAERIGLPRQRTNYHLRELEKQKLIECLDEKRRGSVVQRTYRRTGRAYAISSMVLGALGVDPDQFQDRFSSDYQIALAARVVRELARLQEGARRAEKKLPTMAAEVEVCFASPTTRAEFTEELTRTLAELVEKYHDDKAPGARRFRFYLGAYPKPKDTAVNPSIRN